MMTIYDLIYVMDNMSRDIVVQNDALIDNEEYKPFRGDVIDFKDSELYDRIQDQEVTDLFTEKDGTLWICYCDEEEGIS